MGIPGAANPLLAAAAAAADTSYNVDRSLRFNNSNSAHLRRYFTTTGNRQKWTFSCWIKKCNEDANAVIFSSSPSGSARFVLSQYQGQFYFYSNTSGASCNVHTTGEYRDPTNWYHVLWAFDVTQADAQSRTKIYVNGSAVALAYNTSPSQNTDHNINAKAGHWIAGDNGSAEWLNGYLAEIHFVDNAALDPDDFTETNSSTGELIPKEFDGTYGTNGFHLKFADNSGSTSTTLGKDSTGAGTISAANGGLPFYNTTDAYGVTKGSGYRTDSSAGTTDGTGLIFALPGDVLTDEHDHVNTGSSAKTLSNNSVSVSTVESKFYGSSLSFPGEANDRLWMDATNAGTDFDMGTGSFTIEAWVYLNEMPAGNGYPTAMWIIGWGPANSNDGFDFAIGSTNLIFDADDFASPDISVAHNMGAKQWHHVAVTYNGSDDKLRAFVDGSEIAEVTSTVTATTASTGVAIGAAEPSGATDGNFNGFMNDLRVYKGVCKYTSDFTPAVRKDFRPVNLSVVEGAATSVSAATGGRPIWNTSDTYGGTISTGYRSDDFSSSLYLAIPMNGSNNGTTFTDESNHINGSSTEKTVTASDQMKTKTDQSHFYGSSGYLPPQSSDTNVSGYLTVDGHSELAIGTGDFTIEFWYRPGASPGTNNCVFDWREPGFLLRHTAATNLQLHGSPSAGQLWVLANITVRQEVWQHIAITRLSNNLKVFTDGTKVVDITSTIPQPQDDLEINKFGDTDDLGVGGHMQDFRVYVGACKYTTGFTPPRSTQSSIASVGNDSLKDSPTRGSSDDETGAGGLVAGNYATWNPLASGCTLSEGNLKAVSGTQKRVTSSFGFPSGKWYFEITLTSTSIQQFGIGSLSTASITGSPPGDSPHNSYIVLTNGQYYHNGTQAGSGLPTTSSGDVIGIAFDADSRKLWFSKNGTWMASGDPAGGSNPLWTVSADYAPYAPTVGAGGADATNSFLNGGQRPFAYSAPSGFNPCSTAFLADPSIAKPLEHFNVVLYTGTGSDHAVSGFGFAPDLVWVKRRDGANGQNLFDQIRGATKYLSSSSSNAEGTDADELKSFDSDGFTYGGNAGAMLRVVVMWVGLGIWVEVIQPLAAGQYRLRLELIPQMVCLLLAGQEQAALERLLTV